MEPLKITWKILTPVMLSDHPLHFDGLLAWVAVQRAMQEGVEDPLQAQHDLPLERSGQIWKASHVFFQPGPRVRESVTKRFSMDTLASTKGKVWEGSTDKPSGGSGRLKAFFLTRDGQWSRTAVAWCVGSQSMIEEMLHDIIHLGKYGRIGCGEVESVIVEKAPTDEADFWKLRSVPVDQATDLLTAAEYGRGVATVTPPYWDRVLSQEAFVPLQVPVTW